MTHWFGPVFVDLQWADDLKWDWTPANGKDVLTDFVRVGVLHRAGEAHALYQLVIGPAFFTLAVVR